MRHRSALPPTLPVSTTRLRQGLAATLRLVVFAVASTAACNGQGEGQLCDPKAGNTGNDDCQSGLTCQFRPAYVITSYGLCCPPSGQSTTTACSVNGSSVDASPAPPADAAFMEPTADAAYDGADAPADGTADSADAPNESAADAAVGADGSDATTE